MISDLAWNTFKKTGDINVYLELREIQKIKENIKGSLNETSKTQWGDFS